MFKFFKKKSPIVHPTTSFMPDVPRKPGYEVIRSILYEWTIIRFVVPDHAWNELQESKEWKDFEALLEKVQTEHIQNVH